MKMCIDCSGTFPSTSSWECPHCGKSPNDLEGFISFAPELARENDGMPGEYAFEDLFRLESQSWWFCARNALILWAISKYVPDAISFLEIGCGTGFVLNGIRAAYPRLHLVASEVYHAGLGFAKQRVPECQFIQMDARRIPFVNEFDLIGAFDVLEHIEQDEEVLVQINKALTKNSGTLILTVPQHQFLWSYVDEYSKHVRRYSRSELSRKLEKAGFRIVFMTSFVSLLLPLMFVSRAICSKTAENFDPTSEFKISALMNRSLSAVMLIERAFIKAGLKPPLGGSLLLVAKAC